MNRSRFESHATRKPLAIGWTMLLMLALVGLIRTTAIGYGAEPAAAEKLPQVLILGDSISMGYTPIVREKLKGKADVSRPKGNCQHSAYGLANVKSWVGTTKWDVIHFNFGIWDTHMLDENNQLVRDEAAAKGPMHIRHTPEQYRENLAKIIEVLEGTGAKLIFANTTPIMRRSGKRFEDIAVLNATADKLMREKHIPINDLYEYTLPNVAAWQTDDKVHFNNLGNEKLGERVSEVILQTLEAKDSKADQKPSPASKALRYDQAGRRLFATVTRAGRRGPQIAQIYQDF